MNYKPLRDEFNKRGLHYVLIDRCEKFGLFKLEIQSYTGKTVLVGYEVSPIRKYPPLKRLKEKGEMLPIEAIVTNEDFQVLGGKAFFPEDYVRAITYFLLKRDSME